MHRLILRTGVLLFAATIGVTLGAAVPGDEQSLKGIQGLQIVIESIGSEVEDAGLLRADIQTDVELRLRLAGIKVLTIEDSAKQPGSPWLYVNAHVMLAKDTPFQGLVVYSIDCELIQTVTLARSGSREASATTWHTGSLGYVGRNNLRKIRDSTKDLVDDFINAYLSVNPKK
jgi:hypothetical protein